MIELSINQAVLTGVGFVVTAFLGYLLGKVKRFSKVEEARIIIEKASARRNIFDAYEKYVLNGSRLTIARYEELLEEYEAYTLLGGNGTAKRYMHEIKTMKPYLVVD